VGLRVDLGGLFVAPQRISLADVSCDAIARDEDDRERASRVRGDREDAVMSVVRCLDSIGVWEQV
jgi:hypothetical protein